MKVPRSLGIVLACLPAWGADPGAPRGGVDAKTAARIETALGKGRDWLKGQLAQELDKGSTADYLVTWENNTTFTFAPGRLALQGLALLEAGVPPSDEILKRVWERLRAKPPETTYDASVSLVFAEGFLRSRNKGKRVGDVEPSVRAWIRKTAEYLASGCYGGAWHYTCPGSGYPVEEDPKARYSVEDDRGGSAEADEADGLARQADARAKEVPWDHSNSQYAVLGLKAASLCGVQVRNARLLWRTVVHHFLRTQERDGPEVKLKLAREESRYAIPDYTMDDESPPRARGWDYSDPGPAGAAYATMTAAGITALLVAQSEVPDLDGRERARIKASVRDALAWFQENWSVEENARCHPDLRLRVLSRYYHLYGIERIGTLTAVRSLAGHAWYPEGAEVILREQLPDGHWSETPDTAPEDSRVKTAFALLFLARSFREDYTLGETKR